jgi:hypothetical protein
MIDNHTSFNLTTKQLRFLQSYSAIHSISMGESIRRAIEELKRKERLKEIKRIRGTF